MGRVDEPIVARVHLTVACRTPEDLVVLLRDLVKVVKVPCERLEVETLVPLRVRIEPP